MKLQEVFGLEDINELPIIYNIAWYEQKAVIVLLALLSPRGKKYSPWTNTSGLPFSKCNQNSG